MKLELKGQLGMYFDKTCIFRMRLGKTMHQISATAERGEYQRLKQEWFSHASPPVAPAFMELSLKMVNTLINGDATRLREAEAAAHAAVDARLKLWDGVLAAIEQRVRVLHCAG